VRASNQHGPFGSLDATQATKRNANAGFGLFDATHAHQHLRPGSPKRVHATNRALGGATDCAPGRARGEPHPRHELSGSALAHADFEDTTAERELLLMEKKAFILVGKGF
jgi:hypothetical protein